MKKKTKIIIVSIIILLIMLFIIIGRNELKKYETCTGIITEIKENAIYIENLDDDSQIYKFYTNKIIILNENKKIINKNNLHVNDKILIVTKKTKLVDVFGHEVPELDNVKLIMVLESDS